MRELANRIRTALLMGSRSRCAAAMVLLVCLTLASGCSNATKAQPRVSAPQKATAALTVQRGEIRLEGVVRSIDTKARSLVLEARKTTLPGSKPNKIDPAREKTVTIADLTMLSRDGGVARKLDLATIRAGETISVIGKNLGNGKPLPARVVIARNQAAAKAPYPIEITDSALRHIIDRHTPNGSMNAGKSVFAAGEDIPALIKKAEHTEPARQPNGKFQRVCDAGRPIGTDRASGNQTSTYTVITTESGTLVTAFPGLP